MTNHTPHIQIQDIKEVVLENLCYTELVYARINKKLGLQLSHADIEQLVLVVLTEADNSLFIKKGKNIYISHNDRKIRLTINSNTNRIITTDKL